MLLIVFFSTDKRKFIVADTPGHEQYTRNMVTGASTAGVAVILIDARKGVLTQTKRHSYLVSLVGIRNVVVAVNKMDLVDYSQQRFEEICQDYRELTDDLDFEEIVYIPLSALNGDNVIYNSKGQGDRSQEPGLNLEPDTLNLEPRTSGANMPWYSGPTLLEYLETVQVNDRAQDQPFRMRVQWVNRPNLDFRGFCGHNCRRVRQAGRCGCCPHPRDRSARSPGL